MNIDGTFYINFDDGDQENNVPADRVRVIIDRDCYGEVFAVNANPAVSVMGGKRIGDRIEADWRNTGAWYPGNYLFKY